MIRSEPKGGDPMSRIVLIGLTLAAFGLLALVVNFFRRY